MGFHMFWFDFVGERSQVSQEFAIEPVCVVENKYVEGLVRRHKTMRPLPVSIEEALFKKHFGRSNCETICCHSACSSDSFLHFTQSQQEVTHVMTGSFRPSD